jgi:Flp pilus assembly secretin CpaC
MFRFSLRTLLSRKPRIRFRIATLLWLTACVAAFFGGLAVRPKPPESSNIHVKVLAGRTAQVYSHVPVSRMLISDPTIATIAPDTQNSFTLSAKRAGTTTAIIWGPTPTQTSTYEVTVVPRK